MVTISSQLPGIFWRGSTGLITNHRLFLHLSGCYSQAIKAQTDQDRQMCIRDSYVGMQIFVIVTSILQTAAGRMIFARPKLDNKGQVIEIKNEYNNHK